MITRYSSRRSRLSQAFLNEKLKNAASYNRIAGYFCSSIFEKNFRRMTMQYNISATINDFERFVEFNESEKPILSARQGVFGKKDSFKLNMLLENKKEVNAPNYNQDQYPEIDLMFSLALVAKLYIKANDEMGKLK